MQSRWNDRDAAATCERLAAHGKDLALRVYTSRLIGGDPDLVLHGGGNTSVKTTVKDRLGEPLEVLCVKGSGADLATVEPAGLPAVELAPLRRLRALAALDDETMASELRRHLLDPKSPDPSVETLLHAFLPHRFVDHTHADAICCITDQPDGERRVREALGTDVAVLPWVMPGFQLAKAVAAAFERQPQCIGIVLLHHGLFTFGDDARQSYERTITLVDRAEAYLQKHAMPKVAATARVAAAEREAAFAAMLPLLRGLLTIDDGSNERPVRLVAAVRSGDATAMHSAHPAMAELCASGPLTADHVLRTKGRYLHVPRAAAGDRAALQRAVADYVGWYKGYFERHARPRGVRAMLHPMPVVAVLPGCGLATFALQPRAAAIAADIAERTLAVWTTDHALGRYVSISEADLAEFEYWPLELKKLGSKVPPLLAGQVAVVTGAAGAIGAATAALLLQHGAAVVLVDRDPARLDVVAARLAAHRGNFVLHAADLCDAAAVAGAFTAATLAFGGVDLVVQSHGIAHVDTIEALDPARFEQVLAVNATATMLVLQQAGKVLRAQGTGGSIVLQVSKNAFAPGKGFGAYSASKAAALQLGRIAALEFAEVSVRVNMINADAVFGDDAVPSQLWQEVGPQRMAARGLDADGLREYYVKRSLLQRAVTPAHVAEAVLFLCAHAHRTTGAVLPVDGGLPEAFPR